MDNFEVSTFADELSLDWANGFLEGRPFSPMPNSQLNDFAEMPSLDLDIQNDFGLGLQTVTSDGEIKFEPESLSGDIMDQLLYCTNITPQQLSPDPTTLPELSFIGASPVVSDDLEGNLNGTVFHIPEDSEMILPGIIKQELPVSVCSLMVEDGLSDGASPPVQIMYNIVDSTNQGLVFYTSNLNPSPINQSPIPVSSSKPRSQLFTDSYLLTVSTKDFNRHIQDLGISHEEGKKWKKRRRTLKNRGYAQECRQRKVGRHQEADEENSCLRVMLAKERASRVELQKRLRSLEQTLKAEKSDNSGTGAKKMRLDSVE